MNKQETLELLDYVLSKSEGIDEELNDAILTLQNLINKRIDPDKIGIADLKNAVKFIHSEFF